VGYTVAHVEGEAVTAGGACDGNPSPPNAASSKGKIASLGMLTTRGFRDILENWAQIRSRLYDVHLTKPRH